MENLEEARTHGVCFRRRVIEKWVKANIARGAAMCTDHQALSFCLEYFHNDWRSEFIPNIANVFETDITLPGRAELSLPTARPYRVEPTNGQAVTTAAMHSVGERS